MNLKRIFSIWAASMLALMILYSIFGPEGKQINLEEVEFKTTQSSELYFKNMRSYFYDKEDREDANFVLYRIESREKDSLKNKLNVLLVSNWRANECYVRLESGIYDLEEKTFKIFTEKDTLILEGQDSYAHYVFAANLFGALEQNEDLNILYRNNKVAISEAEKKSLRKTLGDYFRLVGKVR